LKEKEVSNKTRKKAILAVRVWKKEVKLCFIGG
jgi:hypothetical protein